MPPKMPAKAIEKKPFRYAHLPREMQTTLAAYLDLQTLKNLACTSKNVRTTLHPVLFKRISAAHLTKNSKAEIIYVPPSTTHVRGISFFLEMVNASSARATAIRNTINCQFGLLPSLSNLRTVALEIKLTPPLALSELERSLDAFEAAIETICARSQQASFTLHIVGDGGLSVPDAIAVLSALLRPFRKAQLRSLRLEDLLCGQPLAAEVTTCEAFGIFKEIAPKLQTLSIDKPSWLAWYDDDLNLANLTTLDLSYGDMTRDDNDEVMAILRSIPSLLRSCGPKLSSVKLDLVWDEEEDMDVAWATNVLASIPYKRLAELRLHRSIFLCVGDWLLSVHVKDLHIDLATPAHWSALQQLLRESQTAVQGLEIINLYYRTYESWASDASEHYSSICAALRTRGAKIRLHVNDLACGNLKDVWQHLEAFKSEVVTLSLVIPNLDYGHMCKGEWHTIKFAGLQKLTLQYNETLSQVTAPRSSAFATLLARLNAKTLCKLRLNISTPHMLHLHALMGVITSRKFSKLRSIKGSLQLPMIHGIRASWHEPVRAQLKKSFIDECRKKGICVEELVWT